MGQEHLTYKFVEIGKQLGYTSQWKPSSLYNVLKKSNYSMKEKVGFVLYCFGWNGHIRTIPSIPTQFDFCKGRQFIEQFDNLIFPCKKSKSKCGSHVWIKFLWQPVITVGVSEHFNEKVIPIGVERFFDGYEDDNSKNCWENIAISPADVDFDEVSLYLGESGKVYWLCHDGDSLGIAADDLLEFFSVRFSFAEDRHLHDVPTTWTPIDREVMRDYQKSH